RNEAAGKRGRRLERYLLAEQGAHGQLGTVHGADDAAAGRLTHEPTQHPIATQRAAHALRIGVEVEQRARALDGGGEIAEIAEAVASPHIPVGRPELDRSKTVRQAQATPIRAVDHLLDAWNHAASEESD